MERQDEIERTVLQAVSTVLLSSGEDLMADEYSNYTASTEATRLPSTALPIEQA